MSGRVEWTPKTSTEVIIRYADFTDELAVNETVTSATCVATVYSGNDPSPAIVQSTAVINNAAGIAAIAVVTLTGGILGTLYQCLVTGITTAGRTITKSAILAIKPPLT